MKNFLLPLIAATLLFSACTSRNDRAFMKATQLVKENKIQAALKIYNEILRKDPNYTSALVNRALIYEKLGEEKMAAEDYARALTLVPEQVDLLNNVAAFYLEQKRPQLAKYYLTRAIETQPEYTIAYVNRAKANQMLGKVEDAAQDLKLALGLEPKNLEIILSKAILDYQNLSFREALDGYSEVLASRPQDYRTYYRRGLAFKMLKTYQNALNDFNTSLSINSAYIPAIFARAEMLFSQGDYEAALADLNALKSIDNKYAPAYDFSGDIYAIEDPVKAASNYLVAKQLDPQNTKRYEAKIKLMASENGRKAVVKKRLERI